MQRISIETVIQRLVQKDPRYPFEAYQFVREALDHTVKQQRKNATGVERHVSGKELLLGVREFALTEFGPLAYTVLTTWNLRCCEDIGEVVFNMVSTRILGTTEKDSREDFRGGYDFEEAFRKPFEPSPAAPRPSSPEPSPSRANRSS